MRVQETENASLIAALLNLKRIPDNEHPTCAVTMRVLKYSEKYVLAHTTRVVALVMQHEGMHVLFGHPIKIGKCSDLQRAQQAAELVVNSLIMSDPAYHEIDAAITPGVGAYKDYPPNKAFEWYYSKLGEDAAKAAQKSQERKDADEDTTSEDSESPDGDPNPSPDEESDADKGGDSGDAGSEDDGETKDGGGDDEEAKADGVDDGAGDGAPGDDEVDAGGEGSGEPGEPGAGSGGGGAGSGGADGDSAAGDVPDEPEAVEALGACLPDAGEAAEEAYQEVVDSVTATVMGAGGTTPGYIMEALNLHDKVKPIPVKAILRRFLTHLERRNRTFVRPNRRFHDSEFIYPTRRSLGLGTLTIALDTSGSMSTAECRVLLSLCAGIVAGFKRFKAVVIQYDTVIQREDEFHDAKAMSVFNDYAFMGRGGTDYTAVFQRAVELRSEGLIMVTDGYPNYWPELPKQLHNKVVWLMTKTCTVPPEIEKYGDVYGPDQFTWS